MIGVCVVHFDWMCLVCEEAHHPLTSTADRTFGDGQFEIDVMNASPFQKVMHIENTNLYPRTLSTVDHVGLCSRCASIIF
jgi:hypothetical protein